MSENIIEERLNSDGYIVLSKLELSQVIDIAKSLGNVTMDKRSPEPYRKISPQSLVTAKANTLSSRFGLGAFPFHTDVAHWERPARYLLLYCENPGSGNRPTELVDTLSWNIDTQLRHSLLNCLWKVGFKSPAFRSTGNEENKTITIRYDTGCMRPASKNTEFLKARIEKLIETSDKTTIKWISGMSLIVDNARMLHARGSACSPDHDRILIRILVGGCQ